MALFPLEIDEPARRPRQRRQSAVVLGAGLAMSVVYFWAPFAVVSLNDALPARDFLGLLTIVVSLALFLQAFLAYRLLSQTRACPALTDALDTFFYERRAGSAVLLFLCIPWSIVGCYAFYFAVVGALRTAAYYHNAKGGAGDGAMPPEIASLGRLVELLFALVIVTTPLTVGTGLWWVACTALGAMCRVLRVVDTRWGWYEGVPLDLDEPRQDEELYQRNIQTGMRWGGRSTAFLGGASR